MFSDKKDNNRPLEPVTIIEFSDGQYQLGQNHQSIPQNNYYDNFFANQQIVDYQQQQQYQQNYQQKQQQQQQQIEIERQQKQKEQYEQNQQQQHKIDLNPYNKEHVQPQEEIQRQQYIQQLQEQQQKQQHQQQIQDQQILIKQKQQQFQQLQHKFVILNKKNRRITPGRNQNINYEQQNILKKQLQPIALPTKLSLCKSDSQDNQQQQTNQGIINEVLNNIYENNDEVPKNDTETPEQPANNDSIISNIGPQTNPQVSDSALREENELLKQKIILLEEKNFLEKTQIINEFKLKEQNRMLFELSFRLNQLSICNNNSNDEIDQLKAFIQNKYLQYRPYK